MNTIVHLRTAIATIVIVAASLTAQAQKPRPNHAPREGFWVVETTPKSKQSTVRFYANDQTLIYEEIVNRPLKIKRSQVIQQLNVALEQAMFVWNATYKVPTDRQWVAIQFDKK